MILAEEDKVLIALRRLFSDDQPRFFVGRVTGYEDGIAAVTGYSWVREQIRGDLKRKADERTKILSVASGSLIVYRLPASLVIEDLRIDPSDGGVVLTDGLEFRMDLTDRTQTVRMGAVPHGRVA